jgi:hypothetical protein
MAMVPTPPATLDELNHHLIYVFGELNFLLGAPRSARVDCAASWADLLLDTSPFILADWVLQQTKPNGEDTDELMDFVNFLKLANAATRKSSNWDYVEYIFQHELNPHDNGVYCALDRLRPYFKDEEEKAEVEIVQMEEKQQDVIDLTDDKREVPLPYGPHCEFVSMQLEKYVK